MRASTSAKLGTAAKWMGRLMALLLLLMWGAFFVEHLSEWFLRAEGEYPPGFVWVAQFFHFTMLVGLAIMLRWDKLGALVTLIGTMAFIISVWDVDLIFVLLVNLVPIVFFSIYWKLRKSERTSPA